VALLAALALSVSDDVATLGATFFPKAREPAERNPA